MTTLEHPVSTLSEVLLFRPASGRRVRAALFTAGPAYRVCRTKVDVSVLHSYAHAALSARIARPRQACRASSWSRA